MIRLVVVGDPIDHSLSPLIHSAALRHFRLEGVYTAERTTASQLPELVGRIRSGQLTGANVTMPWKEEVVGYCDRLTDEARAAGAVNTLFLGDGQVVGANTDVGGIRDAWAARNLPPGPVLILGAGGAAAAALVALAGRPLSVAARSSVSAADLIERVGIPADVVTWGDPMPGVVIVNATPIGMRGEDLPPRSLAEASGLFDMAYSNEPTPAFRTAQRMGIPVVDGQTMLAAQAVRAFELWTGHRPPMSVMLDSLHS